MKYDASSFVLVSQAFFLSGTPNRSNNSYIFLESQITSLSFSICQYFNEPKKPIRTLAYPERIVTQ